MHTPTTPSKKFQADKVLLISFCHFVHDIYSSFLAPLLPFLVEKFALSLTQAGLLTTVMQLPAFFNAHIGKFADRLNVRAFIILAPSLTAIPMSLLGIAPCYGALLLLVFVAGISVSLFHVPAPVMVYKVSGEKTGRGMSFYMTGGELARALGPLAIIGIVSFLGFDGYYPIMLIGIAVSIIMFFKFKDIPIRVPDKKTPSLRKTFKEMQSILLPLTAILFVRGLMHACLTAFLPLFILHQNNDVWLSGIALSIFEGAGVVGVLTIGGLSDRFGRKKLLCFCLVVAPLSLLAFILTGGKVQLIILLITGFSLLSTTPVMLAMIQESSRDGSSSANGIFMMMSFLARSATVVLVGFIADHLGLQTSFMICAIIGLIGIPLILTLPSSSRISSDTTI